MGDAGVAFCSATAADGTVLLAGTGSVAVRIRERRPAAGSGGLRPRPAG
ncbi:hypothetical protein L083_3472 [Actinoplanes sp. N902-109]|nr:hypothetical protein L083_3472 [Actinoplanes sp. N902-109]